MARIGCRVKVAFVLVLLATTAAAQGPEYVPPDKELWQEMRRALGDVPMSLTAHRSIQSVLESVEREARNRAAKPPQSPNGAERSHQ